MTTNEVYDLLCIGNYTKDTIITPAGTKYVDGGAVRYSAHAAAKLGIKTAVVTRLAVDDSRVADSFRQSGIDCFPVYTSDSTLMKLEYPAMNPTSATCLWLPRLGPSQSVRLKTCRLDPRSLDPACAARWVWMLSRP